MTYLVDASIWIAAAMPPHAQHEVAGAFLRSDRAIAALDLTLYETANTVAGQYRRPREAQILIEAILAACGGSPVSVDASLIGGAIDAVAEHGLSAYDAAYVATARRHGWQLVSLDIRDLVSKGLAVTPDAADYP